MELVLKDAQSALTVSETTFGHDFNEALVHQIIVAYSANSRQGTRAQKSRAEVTGSNKKPWRQKGTGRARSGSRKSPIWRSGGVTFAAKPQDYKQKVNKKMYRGAMKSILSELRRQDRLIFIEQINIEAPKTKLLVTKIKNMALKNVLIIINEINNNLFMAARNLNQIKVLNVKSIDPVSLMTFNKVIMTVDAVKKVEEMLA